MRCQLRGCQLQGEPAENGHDKAEGVPVNASFTANVWEVGSPLALLSSRPSSAVQLQLDMQPTSMCRRVIMP